MTRFFFIPNRLGMLVIALCLVALMVVLPVTVFAQDVTDEPAAPTPTLEATEVVITPVPTVEPEPEPGPVDPPPQPAPAIPPETLFERLILLLTDLTYMPSTAAGVIILVGLVKVIAAGVFKYNITGVAAAAWALFFQVLAWIAYTVAVRLGQGENFLTGFLSITNAIQALLPLFGALVLGHIGYEYSNRHAVPVAGFKPPKDPGEYAKGGTVHTYPSTNAIGANQSPGADLARDIRRSDIRD